VAFSFEQHSILLRILDNYSQIPPKSAMGKINSNVLNNFEDYEKLLTMRKTTHGSGIGPMVFKGTSKVWKWHQMGVAHDDELPAVRLVTEVRDDHLENFKFKLMASTFKEPVINFDALGPTHRNPPEVPLSEQVVPTPHFNRYDSAGRRIAYQTQALRDPSVAPQLEKMEQCVIHFYDHCNISHDPAGYPQIQVGLPAMVLFATPTSPDPHAYAPEFD
jgi:hypothetical protein